MFKNYYHHINLKWDEEAEIQALHEQKMNALDALEAQWRANIENQDQSYYASSYSSWLNFGTSIITNIVENLQVNKILIFNHSKINTLKSFRLLSIVAYFIKTHTEKLKL